MVGRHAAWGWWLVIPAGGRTLRRPFSNRNVGRWTMYEGQAVEHVNHAIGLRTRSTWIARGLQGELVLWRRGARRTS